MRYFEGLRGVVLLLGLALAVVLVHNTAYALLGTEWPITSAITTALLTLLIYAFIRNLVSYVKAMFFRRSRRKKAGD